MHQLKVFRVSIGFWVVYSSLPYATMAKVVAQASADDTHKEDVERLVFVDGHLFSGAYDGSVKKWSPDLKLVTGWKAHDYPVYAMTSNNKSTLFTSATDGEIKEWDTKSGEFKQMTLMINPVTEKRTDVKAILYHDGLLYAGDLTGMDREKITYTEIWSLAVSPNGERVFTARDNTIMVADIGSDITTEGAQRKRPPGLPPMPFFTATTLPSPGIGQSYDIITSIEGRAPVIVDENYVACIDRSGMKALVYKNDDREYPRLATLTGHDMILNTIVMDKDRVVSSGWDGRVKLWNIVEEKMVDQVELGKYINSVVWSPNEQNVVYAGGKEGLIVKIQF